MRHVNQNTDQNHIEDLPANDSRAAVTLLSSRDDLSIRTDSESDPEHQAAAAAVVAEAVALAMEAAAAEAAEAVLLTSAAVTEAADRAANAAESARRARTSAADAAAQSVAHEAARTASRVRRRADLAAAQVQQAASAAADELALSVADGTALDSGRMAELLAATVRAAADAAAQETTRAASAVAHATASAAAHVTATIAAAEEAVESEVTATAEVQRELATATAAAVALETDARAVGVATAAREAATALVTEEQDERNADREAAQDVATLAPGPPAPVRAEEADEILAAAEERDARAELRDRSADEREKAASLRSFIGDEQYQEYEDHAMGLPVRRAAALDRLDSKDDRAFAASARARLSTLPALGSTSGEVEPEAYRTEIAAELSHDLRVPLASILGSVEMLEDELGGRCNQAVAAHLARAMRAGNRMVRMLDQNMASHNPGQATTMPQVNLAVIVEQVVLDSTGLLEPVGAVVETGNLPVVRADPDEMYSVLQNLLTNAVKFARPGVPAVVRISARRSAEGWRITVRDNGVGLPDTSGDGGVDVFSLFSRGTSAITSAVMGHGIGLATVARIITAHGGRVGATPAETGAEIWFELPDEEAVR